MTRPEDRWSDQELDRELTRLVTDAVSDVEPHDRLDELRARTAGRRPWLLATGGAVLAAAAVVTAVALVSGDDAPTTGPGPAAPASSATAGATSPPPPTDSSAATGESTVGVYYVGDTPAGPRLYREFRLLPGDPLEAARSGLVATPLDPDYRTGWSADQLLSAGFDGSGRNGELSVSVDPAVAERPPGMSDAEARMALQQVVYTLQAAVQARAPVAFYASGDRLGQVLGVPTADPVTSSPPLQTLSHASLTSPEEGATVTGGTLEVEGVANSFEATVPWTLRSGEDTVDQGYFTAEGWMGENLFPFSGRIDVSSLDPGSYTLIVETDDPSGGAEGPGAYSDSRTIVIE